MSEFFIGKKVKVVESKNKNLEGISGMIIDETKNTFLIRMDAESLHSEKNVEKRVFKESCIFMIGDEIIDGKKINQKSSERLKNGK